MTEPAEPTSRTRWLSRWLWSGNSRLVLTIALVGMGLDQASKLWLLNGFDLALKGRVEVLPVLDIVLVWNRGISYGLFQQDSVLGRYLLAGFTLAAAVALWIWSVRSTTRLATISIALLIAGALGNGVDRVLYGAVVDFVHFHYGGFSWYVFNLADAWIVAGVAGLLYDGFANGPNSAAKSE